MEGRRVLLLSLLVCHLASRSCLAVKVQQAPAVDGAADQASSGSSWVPYGWDVAGEGHHYGALLPLVRPRQRQISDEPELLYALYESPPLLAKEGLTDEEAAWVPDAAPLRTIKEHYVSGSREFDLHFGLSPRTTVTYTTPHTTPPLPPPRTEATTPHTPAPKPHTEAPTPYTKSTTPYTQAPTPYTPTPKLHTPPNTLPFPPHAPQPPTYVLPLQRRPRKYYLTGGDDKKHKTPPPHGHSGFRKYYIDPASKGASEEQPYPPASHTAPHYAPLFPAYPPLTYPRPLKPRPPPTFRQYFLQPPAAQEPRVSNLTSFDVYEKLRKTRMVDTREWGWTIPGESKSTAWVSFTSSSSHPGRRDTQ